MLAHFANAETFPDGPPWAPTANLMVKRVWPIGKDPEDPLAGRAAFDERCPRNGGAEDVELCARAAAAGLRLRSARAIAFHDLWPWRGVRGPASEAYWSRRRRGRRRGSSVDGSRRRRGR